VQISQRRSTLCVLWTSPWHMPDEYKPSKGCSLLIPSGTTSNPNNKHLFVVLTNPCEGGFHLLASVSSVKPNRSHDSTCLLEAEEHPFIQHQSYVLYAKAQQLGHAGIVKCVKTGLYVPKEPFGRTLLDRISAGLAASPMTPRWAKEYFRVNHKR
jgi:hypothetical protein